MYIFYTEDISSMVNNVLVPLVVTQHLIFDAVCYTFYSIKLF